ncbi:MAG: NAD-glutamate dehydrogenase [Phycisphaerales bacterium]|nr:NAD-glutamate dehydrogenase [Phycisphaerales bacterium]
MPSSTQSPDATVSLNGDRILAELTDGFRQTAEEVVPWFLGSMPRVYFQDTDPTEVSTHLRAIIAAKASGRPIEMTLRSKDGSRWTFMRQRDRPGVLARMVTELPHDRPLQAAKIHTTTDGTLCLDTFVFGESVPFDDRDPVQVAKLRETIDWAAANGKGFMTADITDYCTRCSAEYVLNITPLRMCKHMELLHSISGTDGATVVLESETDPTQSRVIVAVGNATTRIMLERVAARLSHSAINIHRAYLDVIDDRRHGAISMLGFVVQDEHGAPIDPESAAWQTVRRDLLRLKWLDEETLEVAYANPSITLLEAEIIKALCHLAHQVLVKQNRHAFDRDRIVKMAWRNLPQALAIVRLLEARFDPDGPLDDATFVARAAAIRETIDAEVDLEDARTMFHKLVDAVQAILRTNVFLEERYALSFRLDPAFLATAQRTELPYGVFFVHGRGFDGFHVRFRDIARGGVRAIRPIGVDQHAIEMERLYDEAYGLAFAQQLKNKDIPEGGSKAAVLLEPETRVDRSVKAFIDAVLDLITPDPATRARVIDYFGEQELLYLGPDENITPELIEWIAARAKHRKYPTPTAFISSKPGAGINHKQYGVTSEGVTVFLDVALRSLGIDPTRQAFTVKITGGPDGDVAGNEIRILNREYGTNACIVGIADGSGSAEDPDGLDHGELLRLVDRSLPIASFDRAKIGARGRVTAIDQPDGVHLRNTLHNRVAADVFVPAGGRPGAIHEGNWRDYLRADGTPSSRLVVEGANLFITPEARIHLSDHGAIIMKDSSANKCGVICSSYEIMACMLLDEAEFMAIKDQFVSEVLDKLRDFARREADLLVRMHRHHPQVPLPDTSVRLSRVMIRTADAIERALANLGEDEMTMLRQLVIDHIPPSLISAAGDRLWTRMPQPYLKWIMAKSLAARIAYREGFEYLETIPMEVIADLAFRYLRLEHERRELIAEIDGTDLPHRERITTVLRVAGILSTIADPSW